MVRKYLLFVSLAYQVDLNGLAPVLLIVDASIVDNDVQLTKCVHCPLESIWFKNHREKKLNWCYSLKKTQNQNKHPSGVFSQSKENFLDELFLEVRARVRGKTNAGKKRAWNSTLNGLKWDQTMALCADYVEPFTSALHNNNNSYDSSDLSKKSNNNNKSTYNNIHPSFPSSIHQSLYPHWGFWVFSWKNTIINKTFQQL